MQIVVRRRMRAAWYRRVDRERMRERIQIIPLQRTCREVRKAIKDVCDWCRSAGIPVDMPTRVD